MAYTKEELQNKLTRYRCCLANTAYSLMKAEQYQTDNKKCLTQKVEYLSQGTKTLDRYISTLTQSDAEGEIDLTNFIGTFPNSYRFRFFANDVLIGSTSPKIHISLDTFYNSLIQSINSLDGFFAEITGNKISIRSDNTSYLTFTLEITLFEPYSIKNSTTSGNYIYSMQEDPTMISLESTYNPFDDLCWVFGEIFAPAAAISFCNINSLIEEDFRSYSLITFIPNAVPNAVINLANKCMYSGGYDGTEYYISIIDADPLSITYKDLIQTLQPVDKDTAARGIFYNPINEQIYIKAINATDNLIIILDSNNNTVQTITLTNDSDHSFLGLNRLFTMDYNRGTGHVYLTTLKLLLIIDGNPDSPNFNTIISEVPLPDNTLEGGSVIWNTDTNNSFLVNQYSPSGSVTTEKVYSLDLSTNFTEVISTPGVININIANGYLVLNFRDVTNPNNSTLNKVVLYNLNDYSTFSTIQTTSSTYATSSADQSDQTRLTYAIEGTNFLTIFESDSEVEEFDTPLAEIPSEQCQIDDTGLNNILENLGGICCDSCGSDEKLIEDIE